MGSAEAERVIGFLKKEMGVEVRPNSGVGINPISKGGTTLIYQAMGFRPAVFPVLFAIGRTAGWVAQWQEMLLDTEQRIARPRQIYTGSGERDYVPLDKR